MGSVLPLLSPPKYISRLLPTVHSSYRLDHRGHNGLRVHYSRKRQIRHDALFLGTAQAKKAERYHSQGDVHFSGDGGFENVKIDPGARSIEHKIENERRWSWFKRVESLFFLSLFFFGVLRGDQNI